MKRNCGPEGPGFWQLDGALFKRFQISGVEVRASSASTRTT